MKTIKATMTIYYDPEPYLDYCEQSGEKPTQKGFLEYVQDWIDEDFSGYPKIEFVNKQPRK